MSPIFRATLRDARLTLVGTAAIVVVLTIWVCAVYPSFRSSFADIELPAAYEAFLGEAATLSSPEGFLSAEFFSWIPALLAGVAIALGTRAIGGEEAEGTLEVLLSQPVSRTRVLLDKTLALALGVMAATGLALPAFAVGLRVGDLDIALWRVGVALLLVGAVAIVYLTLALWLAALLPGRRHAAVLAAGALITGYFLNTLGAAVPALDGWRPVSPLYWADASVVLTGGFSWWRAAALVVTPIVLVVLARDAFVRREIGSGTGAWPTWRREGRRRFGRRSVRSKPSTPPSRVGG